MKDIYFDALVSFILRAKFYLTKVTTKGIHYGTYY